MRENIVKRIVRLPVLQARTLAESELAYALAYELEPESGIKPALADVEWKELPGDDDAVKVFEVTVRAKSTASPARGLSQMGGGAKKLYISLAAALGAAILAAVAVDYALLARSRAALKKSIAAQQPLDDELKRLSAQEEAARTEADALEDLRRKADEAAAAASSLRAAYPDLLDALATAFGSSSSAATVRAISSPAPYSVRVDAIALSAAAASDALAALAQTAAHKRWLLIPGDIAASADGLAFDFSFSLEFQKQ